MLLFWCLDKAHRGHQEQIKQRIERPGDPLEECYELGDTLVQQTLRQASCGILGKAQRRRLEQYNRHLDLACLREHTEEIRRALTALSGLPIYVAGDEIQGDALREFEKVPILTAPLVCRLCAPASAGPPVAGAADAMSSPVAEPLTAGVSGFMTEESFLRHCHACHGGLAEYRKRVLYLLEMRGPTPITPQEKRLILQNYAFFEQHSLPGAGSNSFKDIPPVPRAEAACVCCARLDWLERRYKLRFFADAPVHAAGFRGDEDCDSDEEECNETRGRARRLLCFRGEFYLREPGKVAALLSTERYSKRWPLIPEAELHASSVQHPDEKSWLYLLHTRRVPVLQQEGVTEPLIGAPKCAGIGDPQRASWVCWDCLVDLSSDRPRMPVYARYNIF